MRRYIAISLPSYETGSILAVADNLDDFKSYCDITVIDIQTGDLYVYEDGWAYDGNLNTEFYELKSKVGEHAQNNNASKVQK